MRLAADANVLLSAVLGGRAKLILESPQIDEILTVEPIMAEVEEYAGLLARKKRLAEDLVLLAVGALPVTIVGRADYAAAIPEAMKRIGQRDPDDADLLALALTFNVPVWSNDKDFEGAGVAWLTTEALLRQLRLSDVF
ncbi:MAG: PIN domain-containing protein [Terriglobia bacterium]